MTIDIVTIFPEMFAGPFDASILRRAQDKSLVEINVRNLRDWAFDKHGTVDDRPYGGGPGMILRVDVIASALQSLKSKVKSQKSVQLRRASSGKQRSRVILLSPQGKVFNQEEAKRLSQLTHLIFIAGHYEGVDERVRQHLVDEEISIGDYVLTGGELPTMVVVDAVVRLLPGVVGKRSSLEQESFSLSDAGGRRLLDFPQYTRPLNYKGWVVPEILRRGNHKEIERWRQAQAVQRTKLVRPDLLETDP